MSEHQWKRARERAIAEEVAAELTRALKGPVMPEMLAEKHDVVCETFTRVFDRHGVTNESSAVRIFLHASKVLAKNFKFAQLDAATRQTLIRKQVQS